MGIRNISENFQSPQDFTRWIMSNYIEYQLLFSPALGLKNISYNNRISILDQFENLKIQIDSSNVQWFLHASEPLFNKFPVKYIFGSFGYHIRMSAWETFAPGDLVYNPVSKFSRLFTMFPKKINLMKKCKNLTNSEILIEIAVSW